MRYVGSIILGFLLCFALFAAEPKIIPLGKKISATDEQITGLFQIIEHKNPTPVQVEKTKEFLENNPLPPRQLFFQRREAVDNFFESVLHRDPSKAEMRKTMEFLVEQETIAKVKAENPDLNPSSDVKLDSANSLPPSVFGDSKLDAFDFATAASGAAAGNSSIGAAVVPAAGVEGGGGESGSNRGGAHFAHSAGGAPAAEPEVVTPVLSIPLVLPASPVATLRNYPTLKEDLEKNLGDRVESGQLTREEGARVVKDILADFSGREDRGLSTTDEKISKTALSAVKGPAILPNVIEQEKISSGSGGGTIKSPPVGQVPVNGTVANEMSKLLTDFGKLSLSADEANGAASSVKEKEEIEKRNSERLQAAGAVPSSGELPVAPSDNTGLTPAIVAKSGTTVNLAMAAESKAKVAGWLNKFVDEYLKKGKGDMRLVASPHPIGLPRGSLSIAGEKPVSFKPEAADFLSLGQAAPELSGMKSPLLPLLFWLGFGAVLFRVVYFLRRKSEERSEEDRIEPKIG